MSDQEVGRRMVEEEDLRYFLDAYHLATNRRLVVVRKSERPDFICRSGGGDFFGVELTKFMRSPDVASWEKNVDGQEYQDPQDAYHGAAVAAYEKSRKMNRGDWQCRDRTILVLEDMDCPLDDLYREFKQRRSLDDFGSLGFCEVWIADYSLLDVYGDIELMGIFPCRIRRYYKQERGKPYG